MSAADRILTATFAEPVWQGADALGEQLKARPINWPQSLDTSVRWPSMMDVRIAEARASMGADRWNELNDEWSLSPERRAELETEWNA